MAGEALEALYAHDLDPHLAELAHHFFDAAPGGEVERAVGYARRAADRAVELLAYEEAARLYEQGLQALELKQPVEPRRTASCSSRSGTRRCGPETRAERRRQFLDAAGSRATRPARRACPCCAGMEEGSSGPGGVDPRLVPLLREALAAAGDLEPALRVRLLARLAAALRDEFDPGPRARLSREAVELARAGRPCNLAYALEARYAALWSPDNQDERLAVATEPSSSPRAVGRRSARSKAAAFGLSPSWTWAK